MTALRVSVCVVSWERPDALRRCVMALGQLQYPEFELVIVADAAGLAALPEGVPAKTIQADEANISAARNLGIAHSAGDVVAFIDDDAVPEPTWLRFLTAPFDDADVAAAGGYVRGRNGISWQWTGRRVNVLGETSPYDPVTPLPAGWVVKTEGTNMAVRRKLLCELGGFDPAYRFFLDETDLNLRIAAAGYRTVLVPEAEVHHGFAPSKHRRKDRVPSDLFEIGASWAVFLRKHAPSEQIAQRVEDIKASENARLIRHLIAGGLEPRMVRHLRKRFVLGFAEGAKRASAPVEIPRPQAPFEPFPAQTRESVVLAVRPAKAQQIRAEAEGRVHDGEIVTLFILSWTALFHYVRFTTSGVWEHRGGLFGKSDRTQPIFRYWRRTDRVQAETKRIKIARHGARFLTRTGNTA